MNNNFISTKKTYIAPTAKFVIVETQHLIAGASGAGQDFDGTGHNAKDGIFTTDEFNFQGNE